jgi:hypothetical protein
MNSVLDYSLVGLLLLLSAAYAITSLGPRSLRPRCLAAVGRLAARVPVFFGLRGAAQRLVLASTVKAQGGCGGCGGCGSDQPPAQKPPAAEVRVPVTKIGRRA